MVARGKRTRDEIVEAALCTERELVDEGEPW